MCGIDGLFIKNPEMEADLGKYLSLMLAEMTDRGPDSAGAAIYHDPVAPGSAKVTVLAEDPAFAWDKLTQQLQQAFGEDAAVAVHRDQAVLKIKASPELVQRWLLDNHPELRINSAGETIEIFKGKGSPREFIKNFNLADYSGTHALGHTRMATESAVTTEHSHPFSTGLDLCLVHNGSLSNHNRLREQFKHAAGHAAAIDPALRNALERFLGHLAPERLATGKDAAQNWNRYKDVFGNLLQAGESRLPHLFLEALSQTYRDARGKSED